MSVSLGIDAAELAGVHGWLKDLDKAQAQANRRALLFAAKKSITKSKRELAGRYGIKQKIIARRLKAFPAARAQLGAGDAVRIWLGLRAVVLPKHEPRVAKQWPDRFEATMQSGKRAEFSRRPNPLHQAPTSKHKAPKGHALPIDKVKLVLERRVAEPIIVRHARASLALHETEFRRLLERNARRAAKRR